MVRVRTGDRGLTRARARRVARAAGSPRPAATSAPLGPAGPYARRNVSTAAFATDRISISGTSRVPGHHLLPVGHDPGTGATNRGRSRRFPGPGCHGCV